MVKVLDEASNLRAILLIHVEPGPSLDLHLGVQVGVRGQKSGHAPEATPGSPLGYLLMQRLHEPLVTHEVAGHVHVPVVDQDPVFLQRQHNHSDSDNNNNSDNNNIISTISRQQGD